MHDAVVQVLAFQEPNLGVTMDRYAEQVVPDHSIDFQAWVTPYYKNVSDDDTYQMALDHPTFTVHEAPPGKLSSRNAAHDHAVRRGYDIIVSGDGDAPPVGTDALRRLLQPLDNPPVAASNGFSWDGSAAWVVHMPIFYADLYVNRPLYGRFSAFRASAWEQAGPFDTDLDETEILEVRAVEELDFRRKIEQEGVVVDRTDAKVFHDNRRIVCTIDNALAKFGRPKSEWCVSRGESTFAPRR